MRKTLETQDNVRTLARGIHQELLELEAEQERTAGKYAELLEKAAEMVNLSRSTPMYVRERANRLRDLLDRLRGDFSRARGVHRSLYRQIDRLDDALISAVLSPALEKGAAARNPAPLIERTGDDTLLLYELGGMRFGARGRVLEHRRAPSLDDPKTLEYEGRSVSVFPHPGSVFMPPHADLDLLLVKSRGDISALWIEKIIDLHSWDVVGKVERLGESHRFIQGRISLSGRPIYIIHPES